MSFIEKQTKTRPSLAISKMMGIGRDLPPSQECKCDMTTKLVGDGCVHCNPEYTTDHEAQPASDYKKLIAQLKEPEIHFPGNFDTAKRANALLMCLCQEAADALSASENSEEWPHGATLKLKWVGYGPFRTEEFGWAKRGQNGELVSAYSLIPLDPEKWTVIEERPSLSAPNEQKPVEAVQWRNIKAVVRQLSDWAFGSADDPKYGSCWLAMVTGLTCKDGPEFKLDPLPIAPQTDYKAQRDALLDFANHIATSPKLVGTGWQEMAQTVVASVKGCTK